VQALDEVKTEYPKYFEALEKHPRLLVGQEVPSINGEGMEKLRDSADAAEWQDAVKSLLVQEIKDRAVRKADDSGPTLQTLHAAVEIFQNNADLIPGTKQFDRELADRFAKFAKAYEHRVDGKLRGYTIPVQGLIDQMRTAIATERTARAAAPAAPAAPPPPPKPAADPPQAGIPSKAGAGAETEDFSTLFGTIGLPSLRI
jgi:hypothetical protein